MEKSRFIPKSSERKTRTEDGFTLSYVEVLGYNDIVLRFVDSSRVSVKRANTLFGKEPTTLPWIESFKPDETFFDVGANVGMYSIYAGAVAKARVFSFEPESQNYGDLNRNIYLNELHSNITAFCVALSDTDGIGELYLSRFLPAWSHHDFKDNWWEQNEKHLGAVVVEKEKRLIQGSVSFSLDRILAEESLPFPDHIKIDVDGLEWRVVKGMEESLVDSRLKTVLIEIDFKIAKSKEIVDKMLAEGWMFSKDQVRINQHYVETWEEFKARMDRGKGGQNFIFFRDPEYYDIFRSIAADFVPPNPIAKKTV